MMETEEYVKWLEGENERLKKNLEACALMLQNILEQVKVMQMAVSNILKIMRPILKIREEVTEGRVG